MSSHKSVISRRLPLAVLATWAILSGCWIAIVSGPVSVSVGETVTYVLRLDAEGSDISVPELLADVPVGWQLVSITFEGTAGDDPVSGVGVVVQSQLCDSVLGEVRPGFRRWHFQASPGVSATSGSGEVTVEFSVDSQPDGEFDLLFLFGGSSGGFGGCGQPTSITINPQGRRFLTLLQTLFDDTAEAEGLGGPTSVAVSPDGRHLYVAAEADQAVAAYFRDPASGELTFVEAEVEGAGGVEGLGRHLVLSPDGRHLYAGGAGFSRDPVSGELTFIERFSTLAGSLAASPDGLHLYVSRSLGVDIFSRDPVSGALTLLDTVPQGSEGGPATISPDGRHLYVVDSLELRTYTRDAVDGGLTLIAQFLNDRVERMVVSPDGRHLYAASGRTVDLYGRDPVTGLPGFGQAYSNLEAESVAVSPDGSHVIAASRAAAYVFQRHTTTGRLTLAETRYVGGLPVDGLEGPEALAFAPGNRHLYALSGSGDALLAFETAILFVDGFESGDTSAWSSAVP